MSNDALPYPLNQKFNHLKFIKRRTATEYSAECPVCGDGGHQGNDWPDRFRMFSDDKPLGWCRRCGHVEFADDPQSQIDPVKIKEFEERRRELAEIERRRLYSKIQQLQEDAIWKGWHDAMQEPHRALWRQAGIPEQFQDYWQLGFTNYETAEFSSPAMTIPYFSPGWQATTIQYRLTSPPAPNDKYRFQAGLKAGLWLAEPDEPPENATILCEGMKKAAVTFIELVARMQEKYSVVAVPSKMPGKDLLQLLNNCDPVYIVMDPDAYYPTKTPGGRVIPPSVNRLTKMIDAPKRLVKLPAKADDFFTMHGGTAVDFLRFLEGSKPI